MKRLYLCIVILMLLGGCAGSTADKMASSLARSKAAYAFNMRVAGGLFSQRMITNDQKANVIEYADQYIQAHNATVGALADYVEIKGLPGTTQEELEAKEQATQDLYIALGIKSAALIVYIRELTGGE